MLAYTQRRGYVLSGSTPAHRMCEMSVMAFTLREAGLHQKKGQVLSSTTPAHRMCKVLFIVDLFWYAGLHTQTRGQVLSFMFCIVFYRH